MSIPVKNQRPTPPKNQIHEPLQDQIQLKKKEIDEAFDQMLQTLSETEKTGAQTLLTLESQGQQLDKIEDNLDDINQSLSSSERILRRMKSILSSVFSRRGSSLPIPRQDKKPIVNPKKDLSITKESHQQTKELQQQHQSQHDEEDAKLDAVSNSMKILLEQANAMNKELSRHNEKLTRIDETVDFTNVRIKRDIKKIDELL